MASPAAPAQLVLERISLRYGERTALGGVALGIATGELLSLLGPSGSGKSSLLRVIAGLARPSSGRVLFEGRDITGVPAHRRGFGLMFQDFALFPHRDVGGNVGFGLRMDGADGPRARRRVAEMLELVGLPGTERRAISQLSGGEQQRVALARALAPGPRLLMLDEPMGSLDRALRERLPLELRGIFQQLGVTVIYVTHDQEEAFSVADRIVILRDGRVEADGSPEGLWTTPPTAFVAGFLGFRNLGPVDVRAGVAATPWGRYPAPPGWPEGPATALLRSDAIRIDERGSISGVVEGRRFLGDHIGVFVRIADGTLVELEVRAGAVPAIGQAVVLSVDPAGLVLIPDRGASDVVPRTTMTA
jgi:thiamine transport system ATP-binding protein